MSSERIIRQLKGDDSHQSHSLVTLPINLTFVAEIVKISTKITQLVDFFEANTFLNCHEWLPEMENLLIFASKLNQDGTTGARFENGLKRSLLYSLSEQLFQKSVDVHGEIIINNYVPLRAEPIHKAGLYLNYPESICKLKRAIKCLEESTDTQINKTGNLIREETSNWRDEAKDLIKVGYDIIDSNYFLVIIQNFKAIQPLFNVLYPLI